MKILVVGAGDYEIHDPAIAKRFSELGHEVRSFAWHEFFKPVNFFKKMQRKFVLGPAVRNINKTLIKSAEDFSPNLVFIYRNIYIHPRTICVLKKRGAVVFSYNNDDPFSKKYSYFNRQLSRVYLKSVHACDHNFVFRHKNIQDFNKIGVHNVSILRAFFIKERAFCLPMIDKEEKEVDVIFVGHYELDGRDEYVNSLIDQKIKFELFGFGWKASKYYLRIRDYLGYDFSVHLHSKDYNEALNSGKIALVFLSKLNNDTYTTRCFEIPAVKTMMLCERTEDMQSMFTEDHEAAYFSSPQECLEKVNFYLENNRYKAIAENGYQRLMQDGHEAKDRCREILDKYSQICGARK